MRVRFMEQQEAAADIRPGSRMGRALGGLVIALGVGLVGCEDRVLAPGEPVGCVDDEACAAGRLCVEGACVDRPPVDAGTTRDSGVGGAPADAGALDAASLPPVSRCVVVDPPALDWGGVETGQRRLRSVTVRNCGTLPWTLTGLSLEGAPAGVRLVDAVPVPAVVAGGGSTAVVLEAAPREAGAWAATLRVRVREASDTEVPLSGRGVEPLRFGCLGLTPFTDFGPVPLPEQGGEAVLQRTVSLTNCGTTPVARWSAAVVDDPAWEIGPVEVLPLAAGQSVELPVTLRWAQPGARLATLAVDGEDGLRAEGVLYATLYDSPETVRCVQIDPPLVELGEIPVGSERVLGWTVTNCGEALLSWDPPAWIRLAGEEVDPWQTGRLGPLGPGESTTLTATLAPAVEGFSQWQLRAAGQGGLSPPLVTEVRWLARAPLTPPDPLRCLRFDPPRIDLGNVPIFSRQLRQVVVENCGDEDLPLTWEVSLGLDVVVVDVLPQRVGIGERFSVELAAVPAGLGEVPGDILSAVLVARSETLEARVELAGGWLGAAAPRPSTCVYPDPMVPVLVPAASSDGEARWTASWWLVACGPIVPPAGELDVLAPEGLRCRADVVTDPPPDGALGPVARVELQCSGTAESPDGIVRVRAVSDPALEPRWVRVRVADGAPDDGA